MARNRSFTCDLCRHWINIYDHSSYYMIQSKSYTIPGHKRTYPWKRYYHRECLNKFMEETGMIRR